MTAFNSLLAVLLPNLLVSGVCLVGFALLRARRPLVFAPRTHAERHVGTKDDAVEDDEEDLTTDHAGEAGALTRPPLLPDGLFSWIRPVMLMPEKQLIEHAGLDAAVYLRFLTLGLRLFGIASVYGILVLIPVNATGELQTGGLESLTMSKIDGQSSRLWAHVFSAYLFTLFVLYELHHNYLAIIHLRHRFQSKPVAQAHTVLVQEIPESHQTDSAVSSFFSTMYEAEFYSAYLAPNVSPLERAVLEREKASKKLDRAVHDEKALHKRPQHKTGFLGLMGPAVDSIDHWRGEISELNEKITTMQGQVRELKTRVTESSSLLHSNSTTMGEQLTGAVTGAVSDAMSGAMALIPSGIMDRNTIQPTNAAFVSFTSVIAANTAAQSIHHPTPGIWRARMAPAPSDIHWKNLALTAAQRRMREITVGFGIFYVTFFSSVPMSFFAGLSNLSELSEEFTWLEPLANADPVLVALIEGYLPTVLLIVYIALIPKILLWLTAYSGIEANSWIQFKTLRSYFGFLIFNVLLISTIASSIFKVLDEIVNDPAKLPELLAASIPESGTFFINYILFQTLGVMPLVMLRVGPLVVSEIKLRFLAKTPRERRDALQPPPFEYFKEPSKQLLVFVIGIVYSTLTPLILPCAAFYFAMASIIYRYQLLYVHPRKYESGGKMWDFLFHRVIFGLLIYQLTLFGVLSLGPAVQTPFVLPLPVITLVFSRYCDRHLLPVGEFLPRAEAIKLNVTQRSSGSRRLSTAAAKQIQSRPGGPDAGVELVEQGPIGSIRSAAASEIEFLDSAYEHPCLTATSVSVDKADAIHASEATAILDEERAAEAAEQGQAEAAEQGPAEGESNQV